MSTPARPDPSSDTSDRSTQMKNETQSHQTGGGNFRRVQSHTAPRGDRRDGRRQGEARPEVRDRETRRRPSDAGPRA